MLTGSGTNVAVPIGTTFTTANGTTFATTSELDLNSGNTWTGNVTAINAAYTNISVRAAGNINETIQLGAYLNVIPSQIQVSVNGVLWTRQFDLFNASSTSQIYQVKFNDDDTCYLLFGDGVYGARLPADAQIIVNFYTGGGPQGNGIPVGTVTSLVSSFTNSSTLNLITNTTVSSGGNSRDSISTIIANLPAQQRQVSGLVNKNDIPSTLMQNLSWLAAAYVYRTFNNINGTSVPVSTVVAYPYSNDIISMNGSQLSALTALLASRGELGVQWQAQSALKAPIALQANVRLANKNLQSQTQAQIVLALNGTSGSSPFVFDGLGFTNEYTRPQMNNVINDVSNVLYSEITQFQKIPYALSFSGNQSSTGSFLDITADAEEGYLQFSASSTSNANAQFFLPWHTDQIGSNFAIDSAKNYLVQSYNYGSGTANTIFNDVSGPYISGTATGPLVVNQNNVNWKPQQFSGSNWVMKYLLQVQYVENGVSKQYVYHIASSSFNTIVTVEPWASPLNGGPGISASLSSSNVSQVQYSIIRDLTNGLTGTLQTATNNLLFVAYNTANSLHFYSSNITSQIPLGEYSYMTFVEPSLTVNGSTNIYYSSNQRVAITTSGSLSVGDVIQVYTTEKNAKRLLFKAPNEVFTLASQNITLNFI